MRIRRTPTSILGLWEAPFPFCNFSTKVDIKWTTDYKILSNDRVICSQSLIYQNIDDDEAGWFM